MFFRKNPLPADGLVGTPHSPGVYFFDPGLLWGLATIEKLVRSLGKDEATARLRCIIDSPAMKPVFEQMFTLAPCLCCHYVLSEGEATSLSAQIRDILLYITPEKVEGTRQLDRTLEALAKSPLNPPPLPKREPARPLLRLARACIPPEIVRARRHCRARDVTMCYCPRRESLWFIKTQRSAKLLRSAAKQTKKIEGAICVKAPETEEIVRLQAPTPVQVVVLHSLPRERFCDLICEI